GRSRVVDALLIPDQAMPVTTQIEQLVPIGTVASQAGNVVGEDDPYLLEVDARDQLLEARATYGAAPRHAQVSIDDLNAVGFPAEVTGAVMERILEFQTLLVIEDLLRAGLAQINDGLTLSMMRLNEFAGSHGEPPVG